MKKIATILALYLSLNIAFAQTNTQSQTQKLEFSPDTTLASTPARPMEKAIYCEIVKSDPHKDKISIEIDMGQHLKDGWFTDKNKWLVNHRNKPLLFNSMIDAMNYLGQMGWIFQQAYVVPDGTDNVIHWILKMDITGLTDEEIQQRLSQIKLNR